MIDLHTAPEKTPLYVVYGNGTTPSLQCLMVSSAGGKKAVWGYSKWKNSPGFRTMGIYIEDYLGRYPDAKVFDSLEAALAEAAKAVTPAPSALKKLR